MRNVIYAINVSLDGFIEDKDGSIGWSEPTEELHRYFGDLELEIDVHLYGRRMYEVMAGYWSTADTNTAAPEYETDYARRWKQVANVVFSRTLEQVSEPDRLVKDNVAEEIRRLKAQPGKAMVVGGAGLAASLMQLDLVDEVRLAVHPVILYGFRLINSELTSSPTASPLAERGSRAQRDGGEVNSKHQRSIGIRIRWR